MKSEGLRKTHMPLRLQTLKPFVRVISALLLLCFISACSLTDDSRDEVSDRPTEIATEMPEDNIVTDTPRASVTPTHSLTPNPPTATSKPPTVLPPTVINCVPRNDWTTYIVVSGDTLGKIAQRTGTTVNALVQANCLANANVIAVGQTLRVPRLPVTETPTPQITYPTMNCLDPRWPALGTDFLSIQPNQGGRADCVEIVRDTVTTVAWRTAPPGTTQVTFYRVYDGMPRADVMGVDNVPSDGFGVTYQFYSGISNGAIWAEAIVPGSKAITTPLTGYYLTDWKPQCPMVGDTRDNRPMVDPGTFDGVCYTVAANTNLTISWADAPVDTLEVQFVALIPEGGMQVFATDKVGLDGWSATVSYPARTQPFLMYAIATIPHPNSGAGSDSTTSFDSGLIGIVVK